MLGIFLNTVSPLTLSSRPRCYCKPHRVMISMNLCQRPSLQQALEIALSRLQPFLTPCS